MLPFHLRRAFRRNLTSYMKKILIGGILVTVCGIVFISLCRLQCVEHEAGRVHVSEKLEDTTWLLIIIMSGPDNQHQRDTIRETYLSDASKATCTHKFMIGVDGLSEETVKKIDRELFIHNDLVLFHNLTESYLNLTYKLSLSLVWAAHSMKFNYLLKVDDDSYVRVGPLVQELRFHVPKERLYLGFFNGRANVKRTGKWAEKSWFLCDHYLPYALGGGYVLSEDLVHYLDHNMHFLQFYLSEDVSLGTWLAPLRIHRIHNERFDTEFISRGCSNDYLITHKKKTFDMRQLQENLHTTGHLCVEEFVKRESYKYNWSVLPTQCCARNDKILKLV